MHHHLDPAVGPPAAMLRAAVAAGRGVAQRARGLAGRARVPRVSVPALRLVAVAAAAGGGAAPCAGAPPARAAAGAPLGAPVRRVAADLCSSEQATRERLYLSGRKFIASGMRVGPAQSGILRPCCAQGLASRKLEMTGGYETAPAQRWACRRRLWWRRPWPPARCAPASTNTRFEIRFT